MNLLHQFFPGCHFGIEQFLLFGMLLADFLKAYRIGGNLRVVHLYFQIGEGFFQSGDFFFDLFDLIFQLPFGGLFGFGFLPVGLAFGCRSGGGRFNP